MTPNAACGERQVMAHYKPINVGLIRQQPMQYENNMRVK